MGVQPVHRPAVRGQPQVGRRVLADSDGLPRGQSEGRLLREANARGEEKVADGDQRDDKASTSHVSCPLVRRAAAADDDSAFDVREVELVPGQPPDKAGVRTAVLYATE